VKNTVEALCEVQKWITFEFKRHPRMLWNHIVNMKRNQKLFISSAIYGHF